MSKILISYLALSLWSVLAMASDIDLSLEVSITPEVAPPASQGTVMVSVVNNGPDTTGGGFPPGQVDPFVSVELSPLLIDNQNRIPVEFWADGNPGDCDLRFFIPDTLPLVVIFFVIFSVELDPGESTECEMNYYVNENQRSVIGVDWAASAPGDDDLDLSNNDVRVFFGQPRPIPTMGMVGTAILALLMMAIGLQVSYRHLGTRA